MILQGGTLLDTLKSVDFLVITLGTFIVHELVFVIVNVAYLIMDDYLLFQKYKLFQTKTTSSQRWEMFRMLIKDHFTQLLPLLILSYPFFKFFGIYCSSELPTLKTFLIQMLAFNVIEDTGFYWVHRILHYPPLYKKIHSRHHEFINTFSLVGEIAHPIEFIFNFLLPMIIGPFLLGYLQGVHIATFWFWISFRSIRGADAHSGYNLPFHPLRVFGLLYGGPVYHAFHHQLAGRTSNFGGYKIWDVLMGTHASADQVKFDKKAR